MAGHTFTESAEAIVTRTDDPEELGRIKVKCEAIAGDDEEIDEWIPPMFPIAGEGSNWFVLPDVGDEVEIEYITGNSYDAAYAQSFMKTPRFRWKAGKLREKRELPEEFRGKKYGKRMGIAVGKKNMVVMDKEKDEASIKGGKKTRIGTVEKGQPAIVGEDWLFWVLEWLDYEDQLGMWMGEILNNYTYEVYSTFFEMNAWIVSQGGPDNTASIAALFDYAKELHEGWDDTWDDSWVTWVRLLEDGAPNLLSKTVYVAKGDEDD